MAIYHFTTKIIKASKGQCAVASAAYQAAEKLYDVRLGKSFSYIRKEEVVYSEIMLPDFAPAHLRDRATLWNEVEKVQNKSNSRYARQFEFSLPVEWTREECIDRARDFIQKNFVDKGMIVDWAFHDKLGNPHIHMMCTVRGFNPDGAWAVMEKKAYVRDIDGNRIPEIDVKTGLQKVRIKKGGYEEKLWKRETVQANDWNKRDTLIAWRKAWAEYANHFLRDEEKIDYRSYEAREIEKVPSIHMAPGMSDFEQRGGVSWQLQENREIKEINDFFDKARRFIEEAKSELVAIKNVILRRMVNGKTRSTRKDSDNRRIDASNRGIQAYSSGVNSGTNSISKRIGDTTGVSTEGGTSNTKIGRHRY